jgi:hypothetical protein
MLCEKDMGRAFSGMAALGIVLRRSCKKTREQIETKPHSDITIETD